MAYDLLKNSIVKSVCELERGVNGNTGLALQLKYDAARSLVEIKRRKAGQATVQQPSVSSMQSTLRSTRLPTGCRVLDTHLDGGFLPRGIVEISGESASGKTQLTLQLVAACLLDNTTCESDKNESNTCLEIPGSGDVQVHPSCAVYICTESAFPSDRFQQICTALCSSLGSEDSLSANVEALMSQLFVKACADYETLLETLEKQMDALFATRRVRIVVVDSVAATLRCVYETRKRNDHVERVRRIGAALRRLARRAPHTYVVCVNQVTSTNGNQRTLNDTPFASAFDLYNETSWTPALGATWSSFVSTRIALRRTDVRVPIEQVDDDANGNQRCTLYSTVRLLAVTRSAYLGRRKVHFYVDRGGVHGLTRDELAKRGSIKLAQLG